jgi:hypothetical protein
MGQNPFGTVSSTAATGQGNLKDALAALLMNSIQGPAGAGGSGAPNPLVSLFQALSIPSYTGQLTAPTTPLQNSATAAGPGALNTGLSVADALNSGLKSFTSGDAGAGVLAALSGSAANALTQTNRQLDEQFGASGVGESSDLATAKENASLASEQGVLGLGAQILPTLTGQQLTAMGLMPTAAELPLNLASGANTLGTQEQQTAQNPLTALYNEFTRTQGGLFSPTLNFASGAPTITGPGKGSQLLGPAATLGAAAAGA